MKALVLGYGRSGKAAEALLKAQGVEAVVLADDERDGIEGEGFDFAVVSPGIALTHPWIVEAKRRGIPLKSELQLGCEELKRQGWKLLAVTGSKGKSSVVKVVADAIGGVPCGNYGLPVCEVALSSGSRSSRDARWAVVEVSSFMMETTELPSDTFEAAAILNLQEDHLDRHGSVVVYHGLKRKLLTMAKVGYCGGETPPPHEAASCGGGAVSAPQIEANGNSAPWAESYFDNEILEGNAAIAVKLMRVAGLDDVAIAKAFKAFKPLPHRMNLVAEIDGVQFINDSKATSLAALIAGVKMASARPLPSSLFPLPSVRLIAGGLPKGDDPKTALATLTERVKKVYLIGQSAEAFFAAWKGAVDCEICGTMERAVETVRREAEKGETVLLSPGTASFDQFKSYGERGDVFAQLVKKEGQPK